MYYRIRYKTYKGSTRATILSVLGAIIKAICAMCFVSAIGLLISKDSSSDNTEPIIIMTIIGITLLLIGIFLGRKADKIGTLDFEKKVKENFEFAKAMAKEDPESKQWYMEQNLQYADYVLSGRADLDCVLEESSTEKPKKAKRIFAGIVTSIVLIVVIFGGITLFSNSKNNLQPSTAEKEKYQTYVELNNDILWRFDASITPYVEQFGTDETIVLPKREISGITPVIDTFYSDLDKMRDAAIKKPKTDADESAVELIDETRIIYGIINEVAKYYNDGEYKNDNLAKSQDLHKKYIDQIQIWYSKYKEFSNMLNPMKIKMMSKDLDVYKKNGQEYEYYSLKLLVDAEAITEYMNTNEIDDTNVLAMDITKYSSLLNTLNETYEQYKIYSENKVGSIHLEAFKKDSSIFLDCANRIVKVVNAQDLSAGAPKHESGIVYASEEPTPVDDLSFYLDRAISEYNSSVMFND